MFSHVAVGTNDLESAKPFYDAVMGVLGYGQGLRRAKGDFIYLSDNGMFLVTRPINGQPATYANGGTIGFTCGSTRQVDLWHAAGVSNGGRSIEDFPSVRKTGAGDLCLAY